MLTASNPPNASDADKIKSQSCGPRPQVPEKSPKSGFVLIAVLATIAVLAAIVTSATTIILSELKARHAIAEQTALQLRADGFVRAMAWQIARSHRSNQLTSLFGSRTCRADGDIVQIDARPTQALVDLNGAPEVTFRQLLVSIGLSEPASRRLAAAIADYRDADDNRRRHGAEREAYIAAKLAHGPKNTPFQSVSEIEQVIGIEQQIADSLRAYVTVHSGLPNIEHRFASEELLRALDGSNRQGVPLGSTQATATSIVRLRVSLVAESGNAASRMVSLQLSHNSPKGFRFVEWDTWAVAPRSRSTTNDVRDCDYFD